MNELDTIYNTCVRNFGYEPDKISRRKPHLIFRAMFYLFAQKYTTYSQNTIGGYFGKDHATVVHANKNMHSYEKMLNFRSLKIRIGAELKTYFKDQEYRDFTTDELKINHLERQIKIKEKRIFAMARIIESRVPSQLSELIKDVSSEDLEELKQYRIIPFLKMKGRKIQTTNSKF